MNSLSYLKNKSGLLFETRRSTVLWLPVPLTNTSSLMTEREMCGLQSAGDNERSVKTFRRKRDPFHITDSQVAVQSIGGVTRCVVTQPTNLCDWALRLYKLPGLHFRSVSI